MVSEVVNDSAKYQGRTVTIKGNLVATDEVTALTGDGCTVRVNALKKPFACGVSLARNSRRALPTMISLSGRVLAAKKVFREYSPTPAIPSWPKGEYVEMGFGHMNAFPVELVVMDGQIATSEAPKHIDRTDVSK